jgi:hypothetical protein
MDTIVTTLFGSVLCTMTALTFIELRRIRKNLKSKGLSHCFELACRRLHHLSGHSRTHLAHAALRFRLPTGPGIRRGDQHYSSRGM